MERLVRRKDMAIHWPNRIYNLEERREGSFASPPYNMCEDISGYYYNDIKIESSIDDPKELFTEKNMLIETGNIQDTNTAQLKRLSVYDSSFLVWKDKDIYIKRDKSQQVISLDTDFYVSCQNGSLRKFIVLVIPNFDSISIGLPYIARITDKKFRVTFLYLATQSVIFQSNQTVGRILIATDMRTDVLMEEVLIPTHLNETFQSSPITDEIRKLPFYVSDSTLFCRQTFAIKPGRNVIDTGLVVRENTKYQFPECTFLLHPDNVYLFEKSRFVVHSQLFNTSMYKTLIIIIVNRYSSVSHIPIYTPIARFTLFVSPKRRENVTAYSPKFKHEHKIETLNTILSGNKIPAYNSCPYRIKPNRRFFLEIAPAKDIRVISEDKLLVPSFTIQAISDQDKGYEGDIVLLPNISFNVGRTDNEPVYDVNNRLRIPNIEMYNRDTTFYFPRGSR